MQQYFTTAWQLHNILYAWSCRNHIGPLSCRDLQTDRKHPRFVLCSHRNLVWDLVLNTHLRRCCRGNEIEAREDFRGQAKCLTAHLHHCGWCVCIFIWSAINSFILGIWQQLILIQYSFYPQRETHGFSISFHFAQSSYITKSHILLT